MSYVQYTIQKHHRMLKAMTAKCCTVKNVKCLHVLCSIRNFEFEIFIHRDTFLPREHMRGQFGSRNSVRPSVCPSVYLSHACIVTKLNDVLQIF